MRYRMLLVKCAMFAAAVVLPGTVPAQNNASKQDGSLNSDFQTASKSIDAQRKAWTLGCSLGNAVVSLTTEGKLIAELRLEDANKKAKEMGITLPALPKDRFDKRAQVAFLRDMSMGPAYRDIESRFGRDAAALYRWGIYIHNTKLANVERIMTAEQIQVRTNQVLAECRLPKSLGEPIIAEKTAWNYGQMDRAIERITTRVNYLLTEVRANGRPDGELNDPDIERVIRDAGHRRSQLALRKAVESADTPEAKTLVLLQNLAKPPDAYIFGTVEQCLKELGPSSLPTICRRMPLNGKFDESDWGADRYILLALDTVLFGGPARAFDFEENAKRPFNAPALVELTRCVSANKDPREATFALQRASLATNGRVIPELRKILADLGEKQLESVLEGIAFAHMMRAFESINRFAARGNFTDDPLEVYSTDLDVIQGLGAHARGAVPRAEMALRPAEPWRNADFAMGIKRELLDSVRESLGDLSPEQTEKRHVLAAWTRAVREAMVKSDVRSLEQQVTLYSVQIDHLEKMLGTPVTRRHTAPGPLGIITIQMRESIMQAGQFAAQREMLKDLQAALKARDERLSTYAAAVDRTALQSLTASDQTLVLKHGLVNKANATRAESK